MDVWFIADTHFGHGNIIRYENRPFSSVEEMDNILIENWNSLIKKNDLVYHLGDVAFLNHTATKNIISQLNGEKTLIMGNHDRRKTVTWWEEVGFVAVHKEPIFTIMNGKDIVISHEPAEHYIPNLHGHTHSKGTHLLPSKYKCLSVECTNYKPVHINEVREWLEKYKYA